jgi:hypothetical protein
VVDAGGVLAIMWVKAVVKAKYIRHRSPSLDRAKTPWELFYGQA